MPDTVVMIAFDLCLSLHEKQALVTARLCLKSGAGVEKTFQIW